MSSVDETKFQVFAPNQSAMDEAKEMIEEMLAEEVTPLYSSKFPLLSTTIQLNSEYIKQRLRIFEPFFIV